MPIILWRALFYLARNHLGRQGSINEAYHASGLKIPTGVEGPASVEFRGAPQARSISSGRSGGWFALRKAGDFEICFDDVAERNRL